MSSSSCLADEFEPEIRNYVERILKDEEAPEREMSIAPDALPPPPNYRVPVEGVSDLPDIPEQFYRQLSINGIRALPDDGTYHSYDALFTHPAYFIAKGYCFRQVLKEYLCIYVETQVHIWGLPPYVIPQIRSRPLIPPAPKPHRCWNKKASNQAIL